MTSNVINIDFNSKKKQDDAHLPTRIWECPCGSNKFYLTEHGNCECAECNTESTNLFCYCSKV